MLHFPDRFAQLVVQVPRRVLADTRLSGATAVPLDAGGSGRLVAEFFVGLARQCRADPAGAAALAPNAVGLLRSTLGMASGAAPGPVPAAALALARERVLAHLRRHLADDMLDADTIAAACRMSRRTLFRLFTGDPDGLMGTLRRLRVERAEALLRAAPSRPLAAVAADCGFGGTAQLHRAFRLLVGTTPGAFRAAAGGAFAGS